MELLYTLLVLLVVTRIFGELAERLGQPVLVGELVSGIALGLVVSTFSDTFPVLSGLGDDEVFHGITELAMFFLMLLAGLDLRPKEMAKASKEAVLIAVSGMLLPLGLGFGLGWALLPESDLRMAQSLFLGTCLAVTAVPVSVKVLIDLGMMQTRLGKAVVAAALIDDILSLLLLGILTSVLETGSFPGVVGLGLLVVKVLVFFGIVFAAGRYALPWLGSKLHRLKADELEFSFLLIAALGFSVLAEVLGMHFILGAFAAGLFFGRNTIDEETYVDVTGKVTAISTGFLAPIFFASMGFHLDLSALVEIPGFVVLLIVLATAGKLLGASLPALKAGFDRRESLGIGVAMNARGAVELILAGIALRAGLFESPDPPPPIIANMFSAVVIMAVVTTLMAPISLKRIFAGARESGADESAEEGSTSAAS